MGLNLFGQWLKEYDRPKMSKPPTRSFIDSSAVRLHIIPALTSSTGQIAMIQLILESVKNTATIMVHSQPAAAAAAAAYVGVRHLPSLVEW